MSAAEFNELLPTLPDERLDELQARFDRMDDARRDAELLEQELIGELSLLEEGDHT